jgi:hypothetical protein
MSSITLVLCYCTSFAGSQLSVVCQDVLAACVNRSILDISHYLAAISREFHPPSKSEPATRAEQQGNSDHQDSIAILVRVNNCCILVPETGWSDRIFALTTPQVLFAPLAGSKFFSNAKEIALCEYDLSFLSLSLYKHVVRHQVKHLC